MIKDQLCVLCVLPFAFFAVKKLLNRKGRKELKIGEKLCKTVGINFETPPDSGKSIRLLQLTENCLSFTVIKMLYPAKISEKFYAPQNVGKPLRTNAVGTGVTFVCGSFVRLYLEINVESKEIIEAKFKSNGCGFTIAAAEILTEIIVGRKLTELHGTEDLQTEIEASLEIFPENRKHCLEICLDALEAAFKDFRALQIEEFTGEKALICTCFGVSEERIEREITEKHLTTVEEIGAVCNAGTGCGSCQFLIREILDSASF